MNRKRIVPLSSLHALLKLMEANDFSVVTVVSQRPDCSPVAYRMDLSILIGPLREEIRKRERSLQLSRAASGRFAAKNQ